MTPNLTDFLPCNTVQCGVWCALFGVYNCVCVCREQGGGGDHDAGVVLSAQWQERAHQETDRTQPHVS